MTKEPLGTTTKCMNHSKKNTRRRHTSNIANQIFRDDHWESLKQVRESRLGQTSVSYINGHYPFFFNVFLYTVMPLQSSHFTIHSLNISYTIQRSKKNIIVYSKEFRLFHCNVWRLPRNTPRQLCVVNIHSVIFVRTCPSKI